jgi:hypothetical protein
LFPLVTLRAAPPGRLAGLRPPRGRVDNCGMTPGTSAARPALLGALLLATAGCATRPPAPPDLPASPDLPESADELERRYPGIPPLDAQLLERQGLTKVIRSHRTQGICGYSVTYLDGTSDVHIMWSGSSVGGPHAWKTAAAPPHPKAEATGAFPWRASGEPTWPDVDGRQEHP